MKVKSTVFQLEFAILHIPQEQLINHTKKKKKKKSHEQQDRRAKEKWCCFQGKKDDLEDTVAGFL